MNKVVLIGRLTKDPELRYTSNNIPVATFTLAVNRNHTNSNGEKEADFINVIAWKNIAESIHKYVGKGRQIAVNGRIQTRTFEDDNGNKRYITEVVSEGIEFLDSKKENKEEKNISNENKNNLFADFGSTIEITDKDLPF